MLIDLFAENKKLKVQSWGDRIPARWMITNTGSGLQTSDSRVNICCIMMDNLHWEVESSFFFSVIDDQMFEDSFCYLVCALGLLLPSA